MKAIKLIANEAHVEGYIKVPDEWYSYDSLARLDILRDWIGTLQKEYDATYIEWTTESTLLKMRKSGAI